MTVSAWFLKQFEASTEGLIWGVRQVPSERLYLSPPTGLGEWSAARHLFHMVYYERMIALPSMRQWLGEPALSDEELAQLDEEKAWGHGYDIADLLTQFQQVREQQLVLLPTYSEATWQEVRLACWGAVTLYWVVSKTYQHTAEHINDILRIALFWDFFHARASPATSG